MPFVCISGDGPWILGLGSLIERSVIENSVDVTSFIMCYTYLQTGNIKTKTIYAKADVPGNLKERSLSTKRSALGKQEMRLIFHHTGSLTLE
jgi:hypothetical protein